MAAKYPYSTKDQVLGGQLSLDIASSAGPVPPTSSYGTARRGKLWLDTSISPNQLRVCVAATAQAGYVAGDWSTLAPEAVGGGGSGYLPLTGGTLRGPLQVNSTINGFTLNSQGIVYPAYPGHPIAFEWTVAGNLVAHVDGTGSPGPLVILDQPASFSYLSVTGDVAVGGSVQGANIIAANNFAGPASYTFFGPGFGAATLIQFNAATTLTLGNLQVNGFINVGGLVLSNNAGYLYTSSNFRAPGIAVDHTIIIDSIVLSNNAGFLYTTNNVRAAGFYADVQLGINGIALSNNAGYLYTPSAMRAVGMVSDGDMSLSGTIWINGLALLNNAGYLYTSSYFRAPGLLSDGPLVVTGSAAIYSLTVNSTIAATINVPNGGITVGTDVTCAGMYRHAVDRGAAIECFGYDWGAMEFAMSNGALLVSPDRGVSGFICTMAGSFSDARLKTDIRDTKIDALAAILATPVREFTWDEEGRRLMPHVEAAVPIGFVAQELEETMPLAVGTTEFAGGTRHIIDQQLTPYLVRAIQQLTDRVRDLERKTDD